MILSTFLDLLTGTQSHLDSPTLKDISYEPPDTGCDTDIYNCGFDGNTRVDLGASVGVARTRRSQEDMGLDFYLRLVDLQEQIIRSVSSHFAADEGISASTDLVKVALYKVSKLNADSWLSEFFNDSSSSSISFSGTYQLFNFTNNILVQALVARKSLFGLMNTKSDSPSTHSGAVGLTFYKNDTEIPVKEMPGSVTVKISRDPRVNLPPFTTGIPDGSPLRLSDPIVNSKGAISHQQLLIVGFEVDEVDVSFSFQIEPDDLTTNPQYLVVARFVIPPDLKKAEDNWGLIWSIVPPSPAVYFHNVSITPEEWEANFTFFIGNLNFMTHKKEAMNLTKENRMADSMLKTLWVGFRQLSKEELKIDWEKLPIPYLYTDQINTTIKYRGFTTTCNFVDKNSTSWSTEGCVVDRMSTSGSTICVCDHLTTFGTNLVVPPNKIDFDYVFRNIQFEKNATLYATEIAILIIFVLLFIWARRADKKDIQKLGVTPLAENNPADDYLYEVIVNTGIRQGAGTTSTVCMQLNGERGETAALTLRDPHRKVLQRNSINRFLLATAKPLGNLRFLRLWHDNAGKGSNASWYCDCVSIIDLQTKVKHNFIVEKWFAVDEDDGSVDRIIPVAGPLDSMRLYYVFSRKIKNDASDKHLWASVFTRPAYSSFTRVERVACCLLVLFLTMVSSCMFYNHEGPSAVVEAYAIGPFAISPRVAFTGIMTSLITAVPVSLIVMIFRNSKLHVNHTTLLRDVVEDHLDEDLDRVSYKDVKRLDSFSLGNPLPQYSSLVRDEVNPPPPYKAEPDQIEQEERQENKKSLMNRFKDFTFPWQMRILAWILLIGSIATSVAFTTFYGISFGDSACKQWLSSLFVSFFTDLCFTQPMQVLLMAAFFAMICRNKTADTDEFDIAEEDNALMNTLGYRYRLNYGEEYLHEDILRGKIESYVIRAPDPEMLERARLLRQKQLQMYELLLELLFFVVFFTLLIIVSNGLRHPMAMRLRESLTSLFFSGEDFEKVNSIDEMWKWIELTLVPNLRADRWYNGVPPIQQTGFIADRKNRIMGYATLRQLRVPEDSCTVQEVVQPLFNECFGQYQILNQDERNYLPGWIFTHLAPVDVPQEYRYTNAAERDGFIIRGQLGFYSGGGYVHDLNGGRDRLESEIQSLREQGWFDHRTRAVIVEMATYNPGSQLFAITTIKFELPGTGGVIPSFRIEPANLLSFSISNANSLEFSCQIFFVIALLGLLIKEIRNVWRQRLRYFHSLHAWAQLFMITSCFAAIAIYIHIASEVKELMLTFYRSNGNGYANFQMVANWNETLAYLVAIITFVAILILMHILRFNKNIGLLESVLSYANRDMKYFFIVFVVIFFSFVITFYLLFFDTMAAYSTMISTMETSFQIVLGKFDVKGMYEREPILGPVVFATFSLFIIFIMLSMFVAILTDSFEVVRKNPNLQSQDHEIVQFMMSNIISWMHLDKFKWGKSVVNAYSTEVTEQLYNDEEERGCEQIIAEFNEAADLFIGHVKRFGFVGVRDI